MKTYLITRFFCATNNEDATRAFRCKIKSFLDLCYHLSGVDMIVCAIFETGSYPIHDVANTYQWLTATFPDKSRLLPLRIQRGGLYASTLNQAVQMVASLYGVNEDRIIFLSPEVAIHQNYIDDMHNALDNPGAKIVALNIAGLSELILKGRVQNTGCMWKLPELLRGGLFPLYADGAANGDQKITVKLRIDGEEHEVELAGNEEVPLLATVGRCTAEPFISIVRLDAPVTWNVDPTLWQKKKLARKWLVGDYYLQRLGLPTDFLENKIIKTGL